MKIGIEIKPFNYNLRSRRLELGYTQKRLAIDAEVTAELIGKLELLRIPSNGEGIRLLRDKMNRIARMLESDFNWLFPQDYLEAVQRKILPRRKRPIMWVKDVDILQLSGDTLYALPSPETIAVESDLQNDLKDVIGNALNSLSPRERKVIEMRFGFDDKGKKTLESVGNEFGVSRERIVQIEAKALRKLRHPMRLRPIREVMVIEGGRR